MKSISFYVQGAIRKLRGYPDSLFLLECYKIPKVIIGDTGKAKHVFQDGHVDGSIIQAHGAEYAKFSKYLLENKEVILSEAGKQVGKPYEFEYDPELIVKAASVVVPVEAPIDVLDETIVDESMLKSLNEKRSKSKKVNAKEGN
jgi:hypothetical protein